MKPCFYFVEYNSEITAKEDIVIKQKNERKYKNSSIGDEILLKNLKLISYS